MITKIIQTALTAGHAILDIYKAREFTIETKDDNSPLTTADLASNNIIKQNLQTLNIPIISEETRQAHYTDRKKYKQFFLVDPLDGTKEFIKGNGEFTVNIALLHNNTPVLGVIYAPVPDILYWGSEAENASWKVENASENFNEENMYRNALKLPIIAPENDHLRVVASKSHHNNETRNYINNLEAIGKEIILVTRGSSLKFCMVAEGEADIYPRLGPTMEWDIAAGHAIAKYSGCEVTVLKTGLEPEYNKEELVNEFFVVKRG